MTGEQVRKAIIEIIDELVEEEFDWSTLDDNGSLRDQLSLDSMDFLDIVMELRKRYGVQVPEDEYMELATMQGCINYLEPKLKDPK